MSERRDLHEVVELRGTAVEAAGEVARQGEKSLDERFAGRSVPSR